MTTRKNSVKNSTAAKAVAAAIAAALAAAPALPALAATAEPVPPDPAICAQSCCLGYGDAESIACAFLGWSWADVDFCASTLVYDAWGDPDYYVVEISAWNSAYVYTICVDACTGAVI